VLIGCFENSGSPAALSWSCLKHGFFSALFAGEYSLGLALKKIKNSILISKDVATPSLHFYYYS
jgi:hypothetical protein